MASAARASSSSPASTSIPPPRSHTYDVFLSFRGEDTRKGFTGHLFAALERKGIKTFKDDRYLEAGEGISSELLTAIEESMFAVTILSPNYASSTWCLDELQHIVECKHHMGLSIVPVFYGVEPSDVRHQKGSFEKAFKKHEERFGPNNDKVRRWRDALVEVANHSGLASNNQLEATLVECIAEHIHKKIILKSPSSTKKLVGIPSRVDEVIRHMCIDLNDVRFIGIWGMGGIGKTTIARAIYEAIQSKFKVTCFLANVSEVCTKDKIVQMQKELVTQANINAGFFSNEYDGKRIIQKALCNKKVLLILDDISDEVQLKNLAGEQDWFGPGSRVIITTRDVHLLEIQEVHEAYKVQYLAQNESFDLFCLNAFKQRKPVEEYLDLSEEVVKYSGGLPLALEVLGSYLYRKPLNVWHSAIEKIKSTPFAKIDDILKISYESLDFMEKNIFLDIACFFKGMKREYVTDVLEKCGYSAEIGIAVLIDRSMVTINQRSNGDVLDMHDLLQDMGRNIVIQESPNDPGKRSRLWSKKDIDLIRTNNKGTEAIQGIVFSSECFGRRWNAEAFSNMTQLKLLILEWPRFPNGLSRLPTSLKVLVCEGYPLKTLPLVDQQYEVVEINLTYSKIEQLWHGKKFLGKLKYLDLSYSNEMKQIPDISAVPVLETLVLESCRRLTEVHPSVVHHKELTLLNLRSCSRLTSLPGKLKMRSLKELILDDCSQFQNLPEFGECMKKLSRLSLMNTSIRKLPTSLGYLVGLEDLNLQSCANLECLPATIDGLKSLKILSASDYGNLPLFKTLNLSNCHLTQESFPPDFGHFPFLTKLDISGNDFFEIPTSIRELRKLRCLKLNNCQKLRCLPELPSSIRELEACHCDSLDISEFNIVSNVRGVFASASQDPGQILLEMLIPRSKIPSWFVHRHRSNSISIPCDYPLNARLGIALCFRIQKFEPSSMQRVLTPGSGFAFCVRNGNNRFITNRDTPIVGKDSHLYIICLSNDYFSDGFHQSTCFEVSILKKNPFCKVAMTSAARWVSIEDIEDLKIRKIERQKKNRRNV